MNFKNTLQEEFEAMGIPTSLAEQVRMAGQDASALTEESNDDSMEEDAIDGKFVTMELLERIAALPLVEMDGDDYAELIFELEEKIVPDGDDDLKEAAENVVEVLMANQKAIEMDEAFRWAFKPGTMKRVKQKLKTGADKIKATKAYRKIKRTAGHLKSVKKALKRAGRAIVKKLMSRRAKKIGALGASTDFASELKGLLDESRIAANGPRAEAVLRLANIFELLDEAYDDDAVTVVLEDAMESLVKKDDMGALTEDSMDDDEFISALSPCLSIVTRSLDAMESGDIGFNNDVSIEDVLGNA